MNKTYQGSCLCGQIRFEAGGFNQQAAHCHCTMCRKFHGAAFGTLVGVSEFRWLAGQALVREYRADNGTSRLFCTNCGASLAFRSKGAPSDGLEIAIALFDEPVPVKPDAHIYTRYQANWTQIADGLPQYPEGRGE